MSEHIYDARAMIREGTVVTVNDTGAVQTVDVVTEEAGTFSGIPVIQPWGFASNPPLKGLKALLLCIGGDPANMRALLYSTARRMGGLDTGEAALYANNGARVAARTGSTVEIAAGVSVEVTTPTVTMTAASSVTMETPVLSSSGSIKAGDGATGTFSTSTGQVVTVQDGSTINID